jgi:hypothetical protein
MMCSKRSEILFKGIEIVIILIFPCRTPFRLDVEVQVAAAKYCLKSKEKYEDFDRKVRKYGSFEKLIY